MKMKDGCVYPSSDYWTMSETKLSKSRKIRIKIYIEKVKAGVSVFIIQI